MRIQYGKYSGEAMKGLMALDHTISGSPLGMKTLQLVKIRVSQMNGCIFCLDLHIKEAKKAGERELRLHHLSQWRESALFDSKERAALEWTELLTRLSPEGVSVEKFKEVSQHLSEKEISDLTFAIGSINTWNRIGIAFRPEPGSMDRLFGVDQLGLN